METHSLETHVESRVTEGTGFVYVGNTRMGFSPESVIRHVPDPREGIIRVWRVRDWPEPTFPQVEAVIKALRDKGLNVDERLV